MSLRLNCPSHALFVAAAKVYPVGIPVLYAVILWKNRALLNPRIHTDPDGANEAATRADPAGGGEIPSTVLSTTSKGQTNTYTFEELQELDEKVKARTANPELIPSMFLWKDFGERRKGIRCLKTGAFNLAHHGFDVALREESHVPVLTGRRRRNRLIVACPISTYWYRLLFPGNIGVFLRGKGPNIFYVRWFVRRPRLVLLRGGGVRPEDSFDGSTDFHLAPHVDTSSHGLPLRLRESSGVRAHAAPFGPGRLVALPLGES